MKNFAFILTILSFVLSAEARLGETQAKVEEGYGKPVQVYRDVKGRMTYIHRFDGYIILVQYISGVSQSENYAKENDAELTETDLNAILSANAQGGKWEKMPKPTKTTDGSVMQGWVILRTGSLGVSGPSVINDKQFQHAISVSTHEYIKQNKVLDQRRAVP